MKTNEFIEYMKKNTNATTREDQVVVAAKKALEVKSYLSINDKKALIDKIINASVYFEDGLFRFDGIEQYVYFTMYTIAAYTNIELSSNIEADFDALSESKLLPVVIYTIQQEYDDINAFLQMQCNRFLSRNSFEAQIGRLVDGILDKVDDFEGALKNFVGNPDVQSVLKDKEALLELISQFAK